MTRDSYNRLQQTSIALHDLVADLNDIYETEMRPRGTNRYDCAPSDLQKLYGLRCDLYWSLSSLNNMIKRAEEVGFGGHDLRFFCKN